MIKVKLRPEQGIKVKTTPAQSPDVKLKTVYLYDAEWIPEINKAVEEANESAEKAKTSAESAEASANSAAESARNADSDADNASESAGLAAQEAQKAIDASTKATQEADAAAESAYQAQTSALAAAEYAQNASSDAENALESLEHVLEQANRAAQQANVATEKADEASQFALECQEIKNSLGSVYKFKGSVNTFDDLPTAGNEVGDVYNVIDTDANYAWDSEKWDILGSVVDLSLYYTKAEVDGLVPTKTSELENDSGFITGKQVYRSLSEEKKGVLVNEGTYDGNEVSDGEIFTEYDGKFVEFKNEPTEGKPPVQVSQPIDGSVFGHGERVIIWARKGTTSYYSDDSGNSWSSFTVPFDDARDFAHNGSLWMAASPYYTATSTDGKTWTQRVNLPTQYPSYLGSFGGKFYMSYGNSYWYSEDGSSWTKGTTPVSSNIVLLCRDEDILIFAENRDIYKSTDGVSWSSIGASTGLTDATYSKAFYVLGVTWLIGTFGGQEKARVSKDLMSWTDGSISIVQRYSVIRDVNKTLAINVDESSASKSSFYTTTDGVSWTQVNTPSSFKYCGVAATSDGTFYVFQQKSTTGFIGKAGNAFSLKELSYNKSEVEALISEETSPLATKEYVDTTEQEIIENFMDADSELQTQITGLSGVLAEEQNKIEAIEGKIPTNASSSNLLSTASDLLNATQDVRADFAEADSELQTQINGQATAIAGKQDKLTAGENIAIENNVIKLDDKSTISGWGMPSNKADVLTLGASGTLYTAPANGYFAFFAQHQSGENAWVNIQNINTTDAILGMEYFWVSPIASARLFFPVKKGQSCAINYNGTMTNIYFRFIYAEGENQ